MATLLFDFDAPFTMEAATTDESGNPANSTDACLYIIYNGNPGSNSVYIGYADDAKNRWKTRWEVFHCFGISTEYAKNILCSICTPKFSADDVFKVGNDLTSVKWRNLGSSEMKGEHCAEHALLWAFASGQIKNGLIITNTKMRNNPFTINTQSGISTDRKVIKNILIRFSAGFPWPLTKSIYLAAPSGKISRSSSLPSYRSSPYPPRTPGVPYNPKSQSKSKK